MENGVRYMVDVEDGQKTGFFLAFFTEFRDFVNAGGSRMTTSYRSPCRSSRGSSSNTSAGGGVPGAGDRPVEGRDCGGAEKGAGGGRHPYPGRLRSSRGSSSNTSAHSNRTLSSRPLSLAFSRACSTASCEASNHRHLQLPPDIRGGGFPAGHRGGQIRRRAGGGVPGAGDRPVEGRDPGPAPRQAARRPPPARSPPRPCRRSGRKIPCG